MLRQSPNSVNLPYNVKLTVRKSDGTKRAPLLPLSSSGPPATHTRLHRGTSRRSEDQLIIPHPGHAILRSGKKREEERKLHLPIARPVLERKANERRPPDLSRILIALALIRRSGHPGGEDREKGATAFSRHDATRRDAAMIGRREEPVDLAGDLVTEAVTGFSERLIIYRTTDRSTPCWIIRGSSVDYSCGGGEREREKEKKRKIRVSRHRQID